VNTARDCPITMLSCWRVRHQQCPPARDCACLPSLRLSPGLLLPGPDHRDRKRPVTQQRKADVSGSQPFQAAASSARVPSTSHCQARWPKRAALPDYRGRWGRRPHPDPCVTQLMARQLEWLLRPQIANTTAHRLGPAERRTCSVHGQYYRSCIDNQKTMTKPWRRKWLRLGDLPSTPR